MFEAGNRAHYAPPSGARRRLLWIGAPTSAGQWVILLLFCMLLAWLARCQYMCWRNTRDLRGVPQPQSSSGSDDSDGSDEDEVRLQWKRPGQLTAIGAGGRDGGELAPGEIIAKDRVATELVLRDDITPASSMVV